MMPTDGELRAADERFEDAIRDYLAAYDESDGLLMEWVLITTQHQAHDDGRTSTAVGRWVPDDQPLYRSLGMLDYQATRLRAHIAGNADTDDD